MRQWNPRAVRQRCAMIQQRRSGPYCPSALSACTDSAAWGSQFPRGRLVSSRVACQASSSMGAPARKRARQGWATMTVPHRLHRFPVRSAHCASNRGRKGQPAGFDPVTEQRQHRRNKGVGQQHTHSRHQESSHADGTNLADGNRQESEKSDGYRRGRNQESVSCLACRDALRPRVRRFLRRAPP